MLRLLEWNINQRNWKNANIPDFVAGEIIKPRSDASPDVVALTEFARGIGWDNFQAVLKGNGYTLFYNPNTNEKGVLLAIKDSKYLKVVSEASVEMGSDPSLCPHFLQLTVEYAEVPLTIICTRILIEKESNGDYKKRKIQLDSLINHLTVGQKTILLGDFNNSYIRGQENEEYSRVSNEYKGKATEFYNYHMLKDEFNKVGFKVHTPKGKTNSWGGYIKNDHIIASDDVKISSVEYSWRFIENNPNYYNVNPNDSKSWENWRTKKDRIGYPDHAILTATAEI